MGRSLTIGLESSSVRQAISKVDIILTDRVIPPGKRTLTMLRHPDGTGFLAAQDYLTCVRLAKSHDISSIKHLWDLLERKISEWNDANNIMDLEPALHQKWIWTPMAVAQRLISSMMRHCVTASGNNGGHTRYWKKQDVTFEVRPLCNLARYVYCFMKEWYRNEN